MLFTQLNFNSSSSFFLFIILWLSIGQRRIKSKPRMPDLPCVWTMLHPPFFFCFFEKKKRQSVTLFFFPMFWFGIQGKLELLLQKSEGFFFRLFWVSFLFGNRKPFHVGCGVLVCINCFVLGKLIGEEASSKCSCFCVFFLQTKQQRNGDYPFSWFQKKIFHNNSFTRLKRTIIDSAIMPGNLEI